MERARGPRWRATDQPTEDRATRPLRPFGRAVVVAVGAMVVALAPLLTTLDALTLDRGSVPPLPGFAPDRLASAAVVRGAADRAGALDRALTVPTPRQPPAPVPIGSADQPFAPIPGGAPRAIVTPTGLTLPVIAPRPDGWLVATPCQAIRRITEGEPIGQVHVVLDPGHGGVEPGAVGPGGLVEKDLNLEVATRAADRLTEAGATVALTRTGDHTLTVASRGLLGRALAPALLVSVHHNGGAPPGDGGPGTIVFTKSDSPESTRFGGLFHESLTEVLETAAADANRRHGQWMAAMDAYDQALAAHQASVAARDAALVANGQVAASATTLPLPPTTVTPGDVRVPREATGGPTTTVPATAPTTVVVPDTVAPPVPPDTEPVPEFRWAGSANAGVRSWIQDDGTDYLGVLRHSGRTPAVLAEFVYVSNPSEEALLADDGFLDDQASALAEAVIRYLSGETGGTGFVDDQQGAQPIGGGGRIADCVEPPLE